MKLFQKGDEENGNGAPNFVCNKHIFKNGRSSAYVELAVQNCKNYNRPASMSA